MDTKVVEVVAALIWSGARFLICQRPAHKARGLLWEFVGGKVEPGETKQAALVRECREELGVTVAPGPVFMDVLHEYPDITVHLTLFHAHIADGVPQRLEHADLQWITPAQTSDFAFCPADETILAKILGIYQNPDVLQVRERVLALSDPQNADFLSRLVPGVPRERVAGARMPALRRLARSLRAAPQAAAFLTALPHPTLDEDQLHALLLSDLRGCEDTLAALDAFLPFVDNWAVCDALRPAAFRKATDTLPCRIRAWLDDPHPYTVRFALETLMVYFLGDAFDPVYLDWAAALRSDEYYVNMMIAWYLATALALRWEETLPLLTQRRLDTWVHNKTIQKAVESRRISDAQKSFLRSLRAS